MGQIVSINKLKLIIDRSKKKGKKVVFTNGCFDILHRGHVRYLKKAKKYGDILVVGLNTDSSVKIIKDRGRPIVPEKDRAEILASLVPVDYVVLFKEPDPVNLIKFIKPDILVKGADYTINRILGRKIVEKDGGRVIRIPLEKGLGTTELIKIILKKYKNSK